MKKTEIYMDKLMGNKEFRDKFDKEYQNLCIGGTYCQSPPSSKFNTSVNGK